MILILVALLFESTLSFCVSWDDSVCEEAIIDDASFWHGQMSYWRWSGFDCNPWTGNYYSNQLPRGMAHFNYLTLPYFVQERFVSGLEEVYYYDIENYGNELSDPLEYYCVDGWNMMMFYGKEVCENYWLSHTRSEITDKLVGCAIESVWNSTMNEEEIVMFTAMFTLDLEGSDFEASFIFDPLSNTSLTYDIPISIKPLNETYYQILEYDYMPTMPNPAYCLPLASVGIAIVIAIPVCCLFCLVVVGLVVVTVVIVMKEKGKDQF